MNVYAARIEDALLVAMVNKTGDPVQMRLLGRHKQNRGALDADSAFARSGKRCGIHESKHGPQTVPALLSRVVEAATDANGKIEIWRKVRNRNRQPLRISSQFFYRWSAFRVDTSQRLSYDSQNLLIGFLTL